MNAQRYSWDEAVLTALAAAKLTRHPYYIRELNHGVWIISRNRRDYYNSTEMRIFPAILATVEEP